MVAIVKVKLIGGNSFRNIASSAFAKNGSIVWVYDTIEEAQHTGSQILEDHLIRVGYKVMRRGRDGDQYAIDLSFKGEKDKIYTSIEKEIRPLLRERILTNLLN